MIGVLTALVMIIGVFLFAVLPAMVRDHNRTKIEIAKLQLAKADRECETAKLNHRFDNAEAKARQKLTDQ